MNEDQGQKILPQGKVETMHGKVTIRTVKWMSSYMRPAAMPSVRCPRVKDWDTGEIKTAVMGINHCLPCACAQEIRLDMNQQTGEVYCDAK